MMLSCNSSHLLQAKDRLIDSQFSQDLNQDDRKEGTCSYYVALAIGQVLVSSLYGTWS